MQNFKKYILYLTWAARFLTESLFAWLALPSSHSGDYTIQSERALCKAISHPNIRTLMHFEG